MLRESIFIDANQDFVFEVSQNYQDRLSWDSFLKEACLMNESTPKVGAIAFFKAWNGINIKTEYTEYDPPNKTTVKMIKGPIILEKLNASWIFVTEDQGCRVTFEYEFVSKYIPNRIAVLILKREMKKRLSDLKVFVEKIK